MRVIVKIFFTLVLFVAIALLAVLAIARTEFAEKEMANYTSKILTEAAGVPISIENLKLTLPNKLQASQVVVGPSQNPWLTAQQAVLTAGLPTFTIRIDFVGCQAEAIETDPQCHLDLTLEAYAPFRTWKQLIVDQELSNQDGLNGLFSLTDGTNLNARGFFTIEKNPLLHIYHLQGTNGLFNVQGDISVSDTLELDGSYLQINAKNFNQDNLKGNASANIFLSGPFDAPQMNLHFSSDKFSINQIELKTVNARADVHYHPPQWDVTAQISTIVQNHPMEVASSFSVDKTWLHLKQFHIKGPETEFTGALNVALADQQMEGKIEGKSQNLRVLQPLIPFQIDGEGRISAVFSKNPRQILHLEIETPYLILNQTRIEGAKINSIIANPFVRPSGSVHVALAKASWDQGRVENLIAESDIDLSQSSWPFSCAFNGKWRKSYHLYTKGKWCAGKNFLHLDVDSCEGKMAKIPFSLQKNFSASLTSSDAKLTPLLLNIGNGQLQSEISYSPTYAQILLQADRVPSALMQFIFPHIHVLGSLSGHAALSGPPSLLEGDLAFSFNDLKVDEPNFARIFPLQGTLQANLRKQHLQCNGSITDQGRPIIHLNSQLPLNLSLFPFEVQINPKAPLSTHCTASFEFGYLLQLFMLDTTHITGRTNLTIDLTGTVAHPVISGNGEFVNGTFESHDLGTLFQNINAKFEGTQDQLIIKEFSAYDGFQGLITGHGSLALNFFHHFPFKIFLNIQNAALLNLDYLNGKVGGALSLFGDLHGAELKGQIVVNPLNITIPEKIPELMQTVDVIYINQPKNEPPPQKHERPASNWPIALDIDLNVPENGYITGRDLTSQWHGDVKIRGTTVSPLFYGEYKIIKGSYVFNGKEFDINEGTIQLAGDLKKTSAYIIASKDLDEVKVEIILKGPLNKPAISFRSNPPLPQREILSWILFNKGTSEISNFQGSQLNESITNLSTKQEGPDILTKIRTTFGIDRIDIGNCKDGTSDHMSFQVGKYISRGVYVSVNKSDVNRLSIEANLRKNVKLQAEVGDDAQGQILLKWKEDY